MKSAFLISFLCLSLLPACRSGATKPKTVDYLLKESQVPSGLPMPTIDWQFDGCDLSDQAELLEEHTTTTGQRSVVYGFTASIRNSASHGDLEIYFKGRSGTNDEWVIRWNVEGMAGQKEFVYVPGTKQDLVDVPKLKVAVK